MRPKEPSGLVQTVGALLLVAAAAATGWLLWHLGGWIAVASSPVITVAWFLGWRLVTVHAGPGTDGNATVPDRERRERPRPDQPHTW